MRHLKELYDAATEAIRLQPSLATDELKAALEQTEEFLTVTKSFEYVGALTIGATGNIVRLKDINTDMDDVVRLIAGKKQNVELPCELFIIAAEEPPPLEEKKEEKPTTETTPPATETPPVAA